MDLSVMEKKVRSTMSRTNFDRLKDMGIEEMAHFLELMRYDENNEIPFCKNLKECDDLLMKEDKEIPSYMCENCIKEWLEREVEE